MDDKKIKEEKVEKEEDDENDAKGHGNKDIIIKEIRAVKEVKVVRKPKRKRKKKNGKVVWLNSKMVSKK